MKKSFILLLIGLALILSKPIKAQEVGVGFSALFPNDGEFSVPISPLSIRGLGIGGDNFTITTGFTFYRMSGLSAIGFPFDYNQSIVKPFNSFLVPLEANAILPTGDWSFDVHFGVFWAFNGASGLNKGDFNEALKDHLDLLFLNTTLDHETNTSFGLIYGLDITYYITKQIGIKFSGTYLDGGSDLNINGTYQGIDNNGNPENGTIDFNESKLDYRGFEVGVGIVVKAK